jgi:hypothetical protein
VKQQNQCKEDKKGERIKEHESNAGCWPFPILSQRRFRLVTSTANEEQDDEAQYREADCLKEHCLKEQCREARFAMGGGNFDLGVVPKIEKPALPRKKSGLHQSDLVI